MIVDSFPPIKCMQDKVSYLTVHCGYSFILLIYLIWFLSTFNTFLSIINCIMKLVKSDLSDIIYFSTSMCVCVCIMHMVKKPKYAYLSKRMSPNSTHKLCCWWFFVKISENKSCLYDIFLYLRVIILLKLSCWTGLQISHQKWNFFKLTFTKISRSPEGVLTYP